MGALIEFVMLGTTNQLRVLAILQARTSSSRLPGKVLADISGEPMILRQITRILQSRMIDDLIVATSVDPSDDELVRVVEAAGIRVARGSLDDVLGRFVMAAHLLRPKHIVRLTGDCPLIDPDVIDAVVAHHIVSRADITSNAYEPTFPDGLDVEVVLAQVLFAAAEKARRDFEREHVTPYIYDPKNHFRVIHYRAPVDLSGLRWTVDEPEDLDFVREVFGALLEQTPNFRMHHVLQLLTVRPELSEMNTRFTRNASFARSIAEEEAARPQGGG